MTDVIQCFTPFRIADAQSNRSNPFISAPEGGTAPEGGILNDNWCTPDTNLSRYIQRLPLDIVLQIIPYTYNLQNNELLNDIKNYKRMKSILLELYYEYYIIDFNEKEPEDKHWLINDIHRYANNYEATMYGYVDKFYNIFRRNIYLHSNIEIDKYVLNLDKKDVSSQINIFLGLLTPKERKDLIIWFSENYELDL